LEPDIGLKGVLDCSAEFGNPSGHSAMAGAVFFFIKGYMLPQGKVWTWFFTFGMMSLIGISRVFGGMHTID
jgi:membrane-associated phospholipid phosphatase